MREQLYLTTSRFAHQLGAKMAPFICTICTQFTFMHCDKIDILIRRCAQNLSFWKKKSTAGCFSLELSGALYLSRKIPLTSFFKVFLASALASLSSVTMLLSSLLPCENSPVTWNLVGRMWLKLTTLTNGFGLVLLLSWLAPILLVTLRGALSTPATRAREKAAPFLPSSKALTMTAFFPALLPARRMTTLPAFIIFFDICC